MDTVPLYLTFIFSGTQNEGFYMRAPVIENYRCTATQVDDNDNDEKSDLIC